MAQLLPKIRDPQSKVSTHKIWKIRIRLEFDGWEYQAKRLRDRGCKIGVDWSYQRTWVSISQFKDSEPCARHQFNIHRGSKHKKLLKTFQKLDEAAIALDSLRNHSKIFGKYLNRSPISNSDQSFWERTQHLEWIPRNLHWPDKSLERMVLQWLDPSWVRKVGFWQPESR